jgi:hypothetical protein
MRFVLLCSIRLIRKEFLLEMPAKDSEVEMALEGARRQLKSANDAVLRAESRAAEAEVL